ncbi:heme peroxidase [Lindgomyces ingoldianus]|uniref:Heme peroxidase n=1 Tax=Lindgomyces ingoldianus TaxID=673940 RepID=A0ACB6RAG7_9PLEO|nr:heme peroxidase [Lindgomyces ingoldianus]KAF2475461.1 heme peroxidase [Lindgomyces ingoldianus]
MVWIRPTLAWIFLAWYQYGAVAAPTWPSSIDELEDIMLLHSGYRGRGFATAVTPCSFSAQGPGRITAAEWIRTAFHDMATGNVFSGAGGLDASLIFETTSGENNGAEFVTTLTTYAPFFSSRASMADIIAIGVYTATRSCGGPIIPVKAGRIDATEAGPLGIPLPQNAIGTFTNQFSRFGYNATEMIQFVACGHTLGGVHSANFPEIVPANTAPNDLAVFDTTSAVFDNKIVTEYIAGTTKDPLVVGPSTANTRNSDFRVFNSDKNVTIKALQDPSTFSNVCKNMFQRMIEIVPSGTTLTDPITPYDIKPYALQLTLLDGGSQISFTGDIRIRTTQLPASQIALVRLVYADRTGAAVSTPIDTTHKGDASGFDDTFTFYGFSTKLSADTSISSFNVVITLPGGSTEVHNNNGNGFKVDDGVIFQSPQSCLDATGKLTIVAAVRNGGSAPNLQVVVKNPRASPVVVPALSTTTAVMATQSAIGSYQLYSASYTFSGNQAQSAVFGVSAGSSSDNNKNAMVLPSTCTPLGTSTPTSTPSSSAFSFQGCYTDSGPQRALSSAASADDTMTVEKCSAFCSSYKLFGLEYGRECYCGNALGSSSTISGQTDCSMACTGNSSETCGAGSRISLYENLKYIPTVNPQVNGYSYIGCYSEGSTGRALSDSQTANNAMTVEACANFCNGATYFGVEYGQECYCGGVLNAGSVNQSATDCSMTCAGNSTEYCGAGNRLNIYKKIPVTSSLTPMPSTTPHLSGYTYLGCLSDSVTSRTLSIKSYSTSNNTYATCADFCSGYVYFGVEYSTECYCSDTLSNTPSTVPESDCNMACSGSEGTGNCGAANRLNVFKSTTITTPPANPVVAGYNYTGCHTDSVNNRVLNGVFLFDASMTVEMCVEFCKGTKYFGTEYGGECYCGEKFVNPTSVVQESNCSFVCGGNKKEYCGGANRLSLWGKVDTVS